ncbi:MAG: SDR family NAD(P)-dependent oxidoreductase [Lachnospiraceae bacterium]|nr:SDR family NAD(P)-dependent oxidoreductase [Lachnospiraceae bacterium]
MPIDTLKSRPVAFVSGASRGIGAGIARALFQNGYDLILTCEKNKDKLEALAKELLSTDSTYRTILTFTGNMGDAQFVKKTAEEALAHFNRIDVVVNNAGIAHIGLITDMSVEQWQHMLDVNLSSVFYTTKAFLPTMIHNHAGNIINISSMWGTVGASCEVAYSATKGAINSYTKALAKELAPSHISVNAIACGVIDTDMNACFSDDEMQALIDEIPAGRLGTPADVGNAVVHLIQMDYVTGQIIGLDGGYI